MQAIAISGFGGPEVFHAIEVPDPIVGDGQVIIDVRATSVNPIDQKIRSGFVPAITPAFPAVLHADVAGIVSAVVPGVTHLKEGDAVWGCAGGFKGLPSGALADRMLTDARLVGLKPASLNFQEAAALPLVGLTSWLSLVDRAQVQRGQRVLIHAGTGGVGHVGVQLAKALGAEVHTTVSSDHKASICRQLGADHTIFYTRENPEEYVHSATQGQGYDVVFDTVGGDNLDASFAAARVGGTVVNIAARSTHDLSPMHAKSLTLHVVFLVSLIGTPDRRGLILERLNGLAEMVESGQLKPLIDPAVFEIQDVADAHAYRDGGETIGKVVLIR